MYLLDRCLFRNNRNLVGARLLSAWWVIFADDGKQQWIAKERKEKEQQTQEGGIPGKRARAIPPKTQKREFY